MLAGPPAGLDFAAAEVRFGKAAEQQQVLEFAGRSQLEFGGGQWVQAKEMEAALERVAAEPVGVEPGASDHEDPTLCRGPCVVQSFEVVPPVPVLVDLVEDPETAGREFAPQNVLAILRDVPVEVAIVRAGQAAGKRRLADLPGAGDEDHLPLEVSLDLIRQVPGCGRHGTRDYQDFRPQPKITVKIFD